MSNFINRSKGSSHPVKPGGTYLGIVKRVVDSRRVSVYIPRLDTTLPSVEVFGNSPGQFPAVDDRVVCEFLNNGTFDVVCSAFYTRSSAINSVAVTTTAATEFDTFSTQDFYMVVYQVILEQTTGYVSSELRVGTNGTNVDTGFGGSGIIVGTFHGTISYAATALSGTTCSVKITLSQANTYPTTVRFARSFCFPAF